MALNLQIDQTLNDSPQLVKDPEGNAGPLTLSTDTVGIVGGEKMGKHFNTPFLSQGLPAESPLVGPVENLVVWHFSTVEIQNPPTSNGRITETVVRQSDSDLSKVATLGTR